MHNSAATQTARFIALGALFLLPFAPLIVASSFFFPFITGKAFYLRILIEAAVVAWAVLALLHREYRPRFSWIGILAVSFVGWMFVADLFAPNVAKAFWSNFERMEGWVLLIHLLGFFFAAGAVLRVEKKWRAWFLTSLAVSVIVSGYALLQLGGSLSVHQGSTRIDATLGNSAYLAVYLLFSIFVALWLALTEKWSWLKWSLVALAALESVLLFYTETRGTIVGLVLALLLTTALFALTAGGRARRAAAFACAAAVLVIGAFYMERHSAFIENNPALERIASISLSDGQTRFAIWHMAWQGFLERPIVGWGQEGFNYVFNKYYDPALYRQEVWFDRAHNSFIDWLSAGGLPAFLLYISLFASAIVLLWKRSEFSRPERILLTAALVGYAIHNVFVFDNLYSYIYFFAVLALIDSQAARPLPRLETAPEPSPEFGAVYALPINAIVLCLLVWYVNIPGMRVAGELITAISPSQSGLAGNLAIFQDLVQHPAFAEQEVREQLVAFSSSVVQDTSAVADLKQQAVTLAIGEMQKQVAAYPNDARERLQLAYAYRTAGDMKDALAQIQEALILSPRKEEMFLEAGETAWNAGDAKAAQAYFNAAYQLAPQFTDLAPYAAAGDIIAGDTAAANQLLKSIFNTTVVDSDILGTAYYRTKDWPRLIALWQLRVSKPGATAEIWFGLAASYYMASDNAEAIAVIRRTVALFPDAAASGNAAISQIEGLPAGQAGKPASQ